MILFLLFFFFCIFTALLDRTGEEGVETGVRERGNDEGNHEGKGHRWDSNPRATAAKAQRISCQMQRLFVNAQRLCNQERQCRGWRC